MPDPAAGLFPALLKHWRAKRGLSQLDLALAADISARHVSFLETGRSRPSAAMVVRLGATLGVPLRHVNAMLRAADLPPAYDEDTPPLTGAARAAIDLMKQHHEPFPLFVLDRAYTVLETNQGAAALLDAALGGAAALADEPPNLVRLTFHPTVAGGLVENFDEVGRELLWRVQREALADPEDGRLAGLLREVQSAPTVPAAWREADLSRPAAPAIELRLRLGDQRLRFLTTVTAFHTPQNVTLDELRVEHWLPVDPATAELCRAVAA